jgi:hypothetical protein
LSNLVTLEFGDEMIEESVVEVLAAEEGVAVGRLDLENTLLDFKDTDVEGASAKVENGNAESSRNALLDTASTVSLKTVKF